MLVLISAQVLVLKISMFGIEQSLLYSMCSCFSIHFKLHWELLLLERENEGEKGTPPSLEHLGEKTFCWWGHGAFLRLQIGGWATHGHGCTMPGGNWGYIGSDTLVNLIDGAVIYSANRQEEGI